MNVELITYLQQIRQRKLCLLYLYRRYRKSKNSFGRKGVRSIFSENNRLKHGFYNNLFLTIKSTDKEKFFNFVRMSPEQYDRLHDLIKETIMKTNYRRKPIPSSLKLSLTLRYLASGDSMVSLSYAYRIGTTTVSEIIFEVCGAFWHILSKRVFIQYSESAWRKIADDFNTKWNFPNCVGAVDGKHVVMQAVPHSGSSYYNYKGSHSIVLMAICDANYVFTLVDIGAQGRQSDGGVFKNSNMGKAFVNGILGIPKEKKISDQRNPMPHVLVADEAFALTKYMLRPYPRQNLNRTTKIFNYRLSRARRTIENAFGILASRWRIFRKPIIASLDTTEKIVQACVCLHNYLMTDENFTSPTRYFTPTMVDHETSDGTVQSGTWRRETRHGGALQNVHRAGSNMYSKNAAYVRDEFANYFMEEGAVPWQWERGGVLEADEVQGTGLGADEEVLGTGLGAEEDESSTSTVMFDVVL